MTDFHFNVPLDGKITFEIHYEPGVLPEVFPEARTRVKRTAKATAKVENVAAPEIETTEASIDISTREETALAIIPEAPAVEPAVNEVSESEEPTGKTNAGGAFILMLGSVGYSWTIFYSHCWTYHGIIVS